MESMHRPSAWRSSLTIHTRDVTCMVVGTLHYRYSAHKFVFTSGEWSVAILSMSDDWRSCRWPAQLPLQTNKDCRQVPIIQLYCKTVPPMISFLDTKLMEPAMAGVHFSQRSILTMAMDTSIRLSASWKKWRMGNKSAILWLFHFGTNHNSNIYEPEDNMWVSSRSIHRLVYFTLDNVWYWTPIDYKVWNWGGAGDQHQVW